MKKMLKRTISTVLAVAIMSGTLPAFGAVDVSFKKNSDGKAEATITGVSNLDKVAIAQYDEAGFLINFGISALSGGSAVTVDEFDINPLYTTKIIPFNDWSNLNTEKSAYRIGTRTYANADMEGTLKFQQAKGGHIIEKKAGVGTDGSYGLHMKSVATSTSDSHITLNSLLSPISDFMVYEFDLKLNSAATHFQTYIRSAKNDGTSGQEIKALYVNPNTTAGATTVSVRLGANTNTTLETGEYYRVTTVANYKDRLVKITVNDSEGAVIATVTEAITTNVGYGAGQDKPCGFRIHTAASSWGDVVSHDFYVDNIRVYEGTEFRDEINDIAYIVDASGEVSIYESEAAQISALSGTLSVHTRSGVAYNGTKKVHLENTPYTENDVVYVPLNELTKAWGVTVTGVTAKADGYAKLSDIAAALGKTLYTDTKAKYNNGLCVLGTGFAFPTNATALQALNDYVFYMRPTSEDIKAAYNQSPSKGGHPRIMASKSDFDRVRAEYEAGDNEVFMNWAESIITEANLMLTYDPGETSYEERWGYNVKDGYITTSTEWMPLAATALTMAYHLTENRTYLDKLFQIIQTVGSYDDWAPTHHLSPPRIASGFIIAYDWAYDAWTESERAYIEKTMYEKFYYEVAQAYQSGGSTLNNAAIATNNHNIVFNAVSAMAGMAFMEAYPKESVYLIENAVRGIDLMMWHWAPIGSWYEGLNYWNLTMEYTVYLLSSMNVTLGTMFGYENCEGLDKAADYVIYAQTQNGPHNYSDCSADHFTTSLYSPEMMWLGNEYGNDGWTQAVIKYRGEKLMYVSDCALGLLWYNTDITSTDVDLPYDRIYEEDDVITMRNTWEQNSTTSFVGIHGGITNTEHSQLDGGSFVFEQGGIRWAIDPGLDNYYVPNYWVTNYSSSAANRWRYFRSMPAAHNTIEIEPDPSYTGHDLDSRVEVDLVASGDNGAIATADMTDALSRHAESATRGFFYTDNRESLVIRDEIKFKAEVDNSSYIINENFDNITETDLLGSGGSGAVVAGNVAGLSADNKVLSLTPGSDGQKGVNTFFDNTNWGDNTGLKVATFEFDYYTTNTWDEFYVYPTAYNRYGIHINADGNNTVMGMTPGWTKVSTGELGGRYEWHKYALEYDMPNGTFKIYMDGDEIYSTTGLDTNDFVPSDFQLRCSTKNGNTYIDNIKFYEGTYGADLIEDETPAEEFDVMWYLITGEDNDNKGAAYDDIDITLADDGKSATLTHRLTGKQMKLEYVVEGGEAELTWANAETIRQQLIADGFLYDTTGLSSTYQSYEEPHKNRITLKVTGSGEVAITVKLTPVGLAGATPISDYNKAISTWTLN